ncbi:MAG TPA: NAD-dependent succinate-semialdehyde dehydrogenase [Tepidisphaeraceae bacterium]|jgi:succinate-semialdehyde dehydrogenase/glutarate-semialdehyde dehydrogenase|nr:NAD-dependent succinate-semialdehyde dehydrogenase [Tepidisphaeraceae bacterium]
MQPNKLYLNGEWIATDQSLEIINPATEETIGRVCTIDRDGVKTALNHARDAFEGWRSLPAKTRADYLLSIASKMNDRGEEIAKTIIQENGKPLAESRTEVAVAVDHFRWFAEECRRSYGRWIPNQVAGKRHLVIKSPVGVVGAISPWNFPLFLSARKIAPALAAGCPVIHKPSELTPLCAIAMAQAIDDADIPKGVFQLILGDAKMIGEEMLENPICRKITFTGSTAVGKSLIRGAAADVKKLSLELGGQAPLIVFDDADLNRAVEGALAAKFRNAGQSCIAANRFYVQRGIYDRFVEAFVARVRAMKVGDGLEAGVEIGPMVRERGLQSALAQVQDAIDRGAKLMCGGKRLARKGFFLEPTVLANVAVDSLCMREETFAPVAPIVQFTEESEAIRMANDSWAGLSAYCFTSNLDRAFRVMERLEAGTIGINDGVPSTSIAPFGGLKQSGWGRELGSEGLDAFLETKHVSFGMSE